MIRIFFAVLFFGTFHLCFSQTTEVISEDSLLSEDNFDLNRQYDMDVDQATGRMVIVWTEIDTVGSSYTDVYCAIYDSSMNIITPAFRVNNEDTLTQDNPGVLINKQDSTFVVAWRGDQSGDRDIYAKKIDLFISGSTSTYTNITDTLVNINEINTGVDTRGGLQTYPLMTFDYDRDELIIGFIDYNGLDGDTRGSFARRIKYSDFTRIGDQFQINGISTGYQYLSDIKVHPLTKELITVCYSDGYSGSARDIIRRVFIYDGGDNEYDAQPEDTVNTTITNNQWLGLNCLAINEITGDYIITWNSDNQDGSGRGAYARVFDQDHNEVKSEFRVNIPTSSHQFHAMPLWNHEWGIVTFIYSYWTGSLTTLRYQMYDANYDAIGSEESVLDTNGTEINMGNANATCAPAYYGAEKKLFVVYKAFQYYGASNSKVWGRTLQQNFKVTNTNTNDIGSLREIITHANNANAHVPVEFAISGAGPYDINVCYSSTLLPTLSNPNGITIDGASQDSSGLGTGDQTITLESSGCSYPTGILVGSDHNIIKNLSFTSLYGNVNIQSSADSNVVGVCNMDGGYYGISIAGTGNTVYNCNVDGVYTALSLGSNSKFCHIVGNTLNGANGLTIGGDSNIVYTGNVISGGGTLHGIQLYSTAEWNIIGATLNQTVMNIIGDTLTVPVYNVIENYYRGIYVQGDNNKIYRTLMGGPSKLNADSCTGPSYGTSNDIGIELASSAQYNEIGKNYDFGNIIIGNLDQGIKIAGTNNGIYGNYIGVDPNLCLDSIPYDSIPNEDGIYVTGDNNYIGADTGVYAGNVIANNIRENDKRGIDIDGASYTSIVDNYIGTDDQSTYGIGNSVGIYMANSADSLVIKNNVISGNSSYGIHNVISTSPAVRGHNIEGNKIGTTADGLDTLGNGYYGVLIQDNGVFIKDNVISGNASVGLYLQGDSATVTGNIIGADINGDTALPNQNNGIAVNGYMGGSNSAKDIVIGGNMAADRNIISGNNGTGISTNWCDDLVIKGNFIGTTSDGKESLPNTSDGISVGAYTTDLIIGGDRNNSEGNIISGNDENGIDISSSFLNDIDIRGNIIGMAYDDNFTIGNAETGINVTQGAHASLDIDIGTGTGGYGNIISGNYQDGIYIETDNAEIYGNYIGTDTMLLADFGNARYGIYLHDASGTLIGGTDSAKTNIIAYNGSDGVLVDGDNDNLITRSPIYYNGGLGINQANSGNDNKSTTTIDSVNAYAIDAIRIVGTAQANDEIELFRNDGASENGLEYIGTATANGSGKWIYLDSNFNVTGVNSYIATATASSPNNTSKFSDFVNAACNCVDIDTFSNVIMVPSNSLCLICAINNHAQLKEDLDGGYYLAVQGELHFKYIEKYKADTLVYEIYDDSRTQLTSLPTLNKDLGANFYTVDLDGKATDGDFYTLEVTTATGRKEKLRFKYINYQ